MARKDDPVFNVRFVQFVENQPCLWNYTHPGYSKKEDVQRAWQQVANDIKDTGKKAVKNKSAKGNGDFPPQAAASSSSSSPPPIACSFHCPCARAPVCVCVCLCVRVSMMQAFANWCAKRMHLLLFSICLALHWCRCVTVSRSFCLQFVAAFAFRFSFTVAALSQGALEKNQVLFVQLNSHNKFKINTK